MRFFVFVILTFVITSTGYTKTDFAVNFRAVSGYRSNLWEFGIDPYVQLYSKTKHTGLIVRVRAPVYMQFRDGQVDPYDWDEWSDYTKLADSIKLRLNSKTSSRFLYFNSSVKGPIEFGLGGLISDFFGYVNRRHVHAVIDFNGRYDFVGIQTVIDPDARQSLFAVAPIIYPFAFLRRPLSDWSVVGEVLWVPDSRLLKGRTLFALGVNLPFIECKLLNFGGFFTWSSINQTTGISLSGRVSAVLWNVRTGVYFSDSDSFLPPVDSLFGEERFRFLDYGQKLLMYGYQVLAPYGRLRGGFIRVKLKLLHHFIGWARFDYNGMKKSLFAGGFSFLYQGLRLSVGGAARLKGMRVYSAEALYFVIPRFFIGFTGARSCDYSASPGRFYRLTDALLYTGLYLKW